MLTPNIHLINDTGCRMNIKPHSDINISEVPYESIKKIPKDSMCLLITDKEQHLIPHKDGMPFIAHVFIGDKIRITNDPYIMTVIPQITYLNEHDIIAERLIRHMSVIHKAWIYKTLLQTIIDTSPDMVWVKDKEERHVVLNKAFCDVVHKDYDFCIGKKHPDIWDIPWEEYESSDFACRQSEEEIMRTGKTGVFQEPVLSGGVLKQFTTYKTPIYDMYGNVLGTCGIGRDVTNVNNMGEELDLLLQAFPHPTFLCDREYNIQRMNASAESIVNTQGSSFDNYKVWKDYFLKQDDNVHIGEGSVYRLISTNRMYYAVSEHEVRDFFGNMTGYLCTLRDVTYQCMYDDLMFKAANVDPLTEAYNRRYFYKKLEEYEGRPFTMIYMDLDNFKKVNDTYGHYKGDEVLTETVKIIKEVFPKNDVVRLGGDEFAVLFPLGMDKDELFIKNIVKVKNRVSSLVPNGVGLGISAGYEATDKLCDIDAFMKKSDEHMYETKHESKRRAGV